MEIQDSPTDAPPAPAGTSKHATDADALLDPWQPQRTHTTKNVLNSPGKGETQMTLNTTRVPQRKVPSLPTPALPNPTVDTASRKRKNPSKQGEATPSPIHKKGLSQTTISQIQDVAEDHLTRSLPTIRGMMQDMIHESVTKAVAESLQAMQSPAITTPFPEVKTLLPGFCLLPVFQC